MALKENEKRLCIVNGQVGYFHKWIEKPDFLVTFDATFNIKSLKLIRDSIKRNKVIAHGQDSVEVFHITMGLVEFADGVREIEPTKIKFCDEENNILNRLYFETK